MTKKVKSFLSEYWQAIAIGLTLQLIIGIIITTSSLKLALFQISENKKTNSVQDQSIFELQINQNTIATEKNIKLPQSHTMSRNVN